MTQLPIVAIVGRPNVGKSSLFNRMAAAATRRGASKSLMKRAVVHDTPGVTRDRNYTDIEWDIEGVRRGFTIVDTGGVTWSRDAEDRLIDSVQLQVDAAVAEASLVLFVVDARDGIMPHDMTVADKLRAADKPIFLVVNKVDNERLRNEAAEFYALGLDEPRFTSCVQNSGILELLDLVVGALPETAAVADSRTEIKIAIVGRPNVGKSSLINNLLGEERMIVDDRPGTTRDAVNISIVHDNVALEIVDTAGMRRKSAIDDKLEAATVQRAIHSIRQSDIAVLVLDVSREVSQQDKTLGNFIARYGKASVLAVNKWDLIEKGVDGGGGDGGYGVFLEAIHAQLPQLGYVPRVFVSAVTGQRVTKILDTALEVYREYCTRISTPQLNALLVALRNAYPPPRVKGVRPALKYITQIETKPPTFLIFGRNTHRLRPPYEAYLTNALRKEFGFHGTPIRLYYRNS